MKIGKYIPKSIKRPLIKLSYVPEKIFVRVYQAGAQGKIYVPDKIFQKWDYWVFTRRKLNFRNPVTFQEKLQWLKYYYHDPLYTKLVDKYAVREWVAEKIGEEYLVPLYGVYNSFDEIDFDKLPNEFVLKCTHDSGSVVICRDKKTFDYDNARRVLTKGLETEHFYKSREWPYKKVPHRIICEKYLRDEIIDDAPDYKFFCFDGKVKAMVYNSNRLRGNVVNGDFFDINFEHMDVVQKGYPNLPNLNLPKPIKWEKMVNISERLSIGFPHVRVDFYYINNNIYFGEMTFYHGGGRLLFEPDEYNYKFGEMIHLPPKMR